jgi:hypothetical protein
VSADVRVTAARDFLTAISSRSAATLPPSVLVREDAELRRHLRRVLDVAADFEVTAIDDEVTQVRVYGGIYFSPADTLTVLAALNEAALCAEQEHLPSSPADEQAAAYRELHSRIGAMS